MERPQDRQLETIFGQDNFITYFNKAKVSVQFNDLSNFIIVQSSPQSSYDFHNTENFAHAHLKVSLVPGPGPRQSPIFFLAL